MLFSTCAEATGHAEATRSFGAYYSERANPNGSIHIHECCEILLCLEGGERFWIDGRIYEVRDGDLFLINRFEPHRITVKGEGRVRRYVFEVHPAFLYANSSEETDLSAIFSRHGEGAARIPLSEEEREGLVSLFSRFREREGIGCEILHRAAALELLVAAARLSGSRRAEGGTSYENNRAVRGAVEYIEAHFASEITLDSVAKGAYVSVNRLCRLFKRYTGTTVNKYIVARRVREAKRLLSAGHSVTETAYLSGFNDYANFIRTFKRHVGISPGKYRCEPTPFAG